MDDQKALDIISRLDSLKGSRGNFESLWQECGDYGMPSNNQITKKLSEGTKRGQLLFDSTAEDANVQLAAGIYSYMFPSESRAFTLKIDDEALNENDNVKQWLDKTTKAIHEYLTQSTFREAFFEFLLSLGAFGTACLYEEKGKKVPINFVCHHMATIYIGVNSDGIVDTIFREFEYTARQAYQEFGDKCSKSVMDAYSDEKTRNKKFTFIHAVYPREDYDPDKQDPVNMPYASEWVDRADRVVIMTSGYEELPYQVSRFYKDSFEVYGRSPMMKKMPDIKMVNRMQKTRIKAWEKMCDPPIILPDDGSISQVATQPAGVIYKRAGSDDPKWFEFRGNIAKMEEAIQAVQTSIIKGFYLDMFDPLIDRQNMTATEVMARVEQKMRFLTPIIGRLQSELFNPLIHRIIGILARQVDKTGKTLIPSPPPELENSSYSIVYLGRLALAIKTLESEGLQKTLAEWSPMAEAGFTSWLDNLDIDVAFRDAGRNNGIPATWLKDVKKRDEERLAKQKAQQAQMMMEQVPNIAKAAKAGSSKPEEGSPTEMILNAA